MFKGVFVEGTTLDDVWFKLLSEINKHGRETEISTGSYEKETTRLEFDFVSGTIYYPTTRPLSPIMPAGFSPVATDEEIEKYFVSYIMDGEDLEKNEDYRYATWIRGGKYEIPKFTDGNGHTLRMFEVKVPDQLQWCINHYKEKGLYNNHCTIQVGYPESNTAYDIPYKNDNERLTSPCLRMIDTKVVNVDGKDYLLFTAYFRSWDLYGAWPTNMGGILMLQEFMASELDVEVGTLSFCSKGLHIYGFYKDLLTARLNGKTD